LVTALISRRKAADLAQRAQGCGPHPASPTPMHQLNEIIWKSVIGANSPMPPPVRRYRALVEVGSHDGQ